MVAPIDTYKELKRITAADDGTLTIPSEVREALGAKPGAEYVLLETEQGVLLTTRVKIMNWALDSIGEELRANGVTLEELIASGREIRKDLLWEMYGIKVP